MVLPSLASSKFLGWPQRSSMMRRRSAALRSCSFFNSSAAFLRNSNWNPTWNIEHQPVYELNLNGLTRSFFFLSGVMKPFLAFLAAAASSSRLRTSAFFRSCSCCFCLAAYYQNSFSLAFSLHFIRKWLTSRADFFCKMTAGERRLNETKNVINVVKWKCYVRKKYINCNDLLERV